MGKLQDFTSRHRAGLLLLGLLALGAPFSQTFFKLAAGTGFTFTTQNVYPGGTATVGLPTVGTAGTYASPSSVTTDAYGRVSSVTAGAAAASTPGTLCFGSTGLSASSGTQYLGSSAAAANYSSIAQFARTPNSTTITVKNLTCGCQNGFSSAVTYALLTAPPGSNTTTATALTCTGGQCQDLFSITGHSTQVAAGYSLFGTGNNANASFGNGLCLCCFEYTSP